MDIKKKFKLLIGKQDNLRSPVEDTLISPEQLSTDPAVAKIKEQLRDPHVDQEILESIEETYYSSEDFDTSEYELKKLPETLELGQIDADRGRLRGQLDVVSRKVYELVLQNHPAYATELQRVMELQRTLQLAGTICGTGRKQLMKARESFTATSLGLLANYRKRHQLMGLLKSLHTIKTLQRTDLRLREMLEEEDYSGAIQLCLECQKAASTFRHFHCISELNSKLQDTLEMIEEQLDVALSKTCNNFDVVHYEKVQTAYRLLGKTQTSSSDIHLLVAMDQLHMHYTSAIHNTAFTIVLGYVELYSGTGSTNFQKKQYSDLCKWDEIPINPDREGHITVESFTPCLTDLCKALWEVMKSHYQTMLWHEQNNKDATETEQTSSNVENTFNRRYVKQKLQHGMGRIWQDVQQKVKTFILGTDLSFFKFEEFIQVLDLVNRLIEIGEEFCGSKSESLQDVLKQQSLNYFRNHHRVKMDELRMFLENEGWELCPVRSNFNLLQLLEFRFMQNWSQNSSGVNSPAKMVAKQDTKSNLGAGYFSNFEEKCNPFDLQPEEEEQEDVFAKSMDRDGFDNGSVESDSDSDVPEELKQEYIDEHTGETQPNHRRPRARSRSGFKSVPIVTNTSLNILRVMGRYMKMMTVLKPIAFDVITCMSQLFDYYMYTVYIFFASDGPEINDRTMNNRLKISLQRIHESLIADETVPGINGAPEERTDKIPQAHLSPIVDLSNREKLYGLSERIVAAESLVFLAEQFEFLQSYLDSTIPQNKKAFLQQFYSQTVKMAAELRKPIYRVVSTQAIDYASLVNQMSMVKWDVKDIMSQHNTYVDIILKSFEDFKFRLHEVSRHVPISKVVHDTLWEHCVRLANHMFVEGYANAKKCSNEGRAWMQLDFQQFLTKLEKFVDIRPIPEREYVETYIKAYYLPEIQLEVWLQDHKEYSNKQLLALISSVDHINRKARQRLVNMVDEFDKNRR